MVLYSVLKGVKYVEILFSVLTQSVPNKIRSEICERDLDDDSLTLNSV